MSVLVKGIELPEKVQVLELHPDGKVFTRKGYLVGEAVELPDHHGRLVDADALRDRLRNLADDDWNANTTTTWSEAFSECDDMVDDAPTIVEAEDSE